MLIAPPPALAGVDASGKADAGAKVDAAREEPKATVRIGDHKAARGRLVAKARPFTGARAFATMMSDKGVRIAHSYRNIPGLVRIDAAEGVAASADGKPAAKVDDDSWVTDKIAELKATGMFEYVEPDWRVHVLQGTPNDSAFRDGTLWGLRNTGQSGGTAGIDVNAVRAWGVTTGSRDVVVAVIDTGVRYTHRDLAGNMWVNPDEIPGNGRDDDNNGYVDDVHGINAITGSGDPNDDQDHGTHVAGTIAATANDSGRHVGVAYDVRIMGCKFLSATGGGNTSDAIKCIDYAIAEGATLTNNSWGGGGFSRALRDAIARSNNAKQLFVAAAGNESNDNDRNPSYPASYDVPNIVSVAAVDRRGAKANFSNFGARSVDLGAPGVSILSSTRSSDSSYSSFNGTSMASPHVAGVAALVASRFQGISVAELKNRLLSTVRPLASMRGTTLTGGIVDAHAALVGEEDGVLELSASATETPLRGGDVATVEVSVTDLRPVTGATVSARFGNASAVTFRDNGVAPDATASDAVYTARVPVPTGVASARLNVSASAPGKQAAQQGFDFAVSSPPPNDRFASRIALAQGTTRATGSNASAGSEPGEPRNPAVAGGKSVWWSWRAPASGSATISTTGSNFDTTLAIYRGTSLAGLTLVGANDDASGLQSAVTFSAVGGTVYQVQVDGYSGREGNIQLNYPSPGAATGLPSIVTQPVGRTVALGAPFELSVEASGTAPLRYQWRRNGAAIAGATSRTFSRGAATEADEGSYDVTVSNSAGTVTSTSAFVSVERVGVAPVNDRFENAATLAGATGRSNGSNVRAGGESGEPNHAGASSPLASVWYRWTSPSAGELVLDTFGSDFDTTLAAYRGSRVNALTVLAANDDAGGGEQSRVTLRVAANATVYVAVDGTGSREGQVVLNHAFTPDGGGGQANDAFASRAVLGTRATGSNVGAGGESGEPNHAARSNPIASLWWRWRAPANGQVVMSTEGSDFDTTLAVYTGTSVVSLEEVASNDDAETRSGLTSEVSFAATAGIEYAIAVDGFASSEGAIELGAMFLPRESNDDFAERRVLVGNVSTVDSNAQATGEAGEPNHAGVSDPLQSLWYAWRAPVSGTVAIDTNGSDIDTTLAVYTGSAVNALGEVASNDDDFGTTSAVEFLALAGREYAIAVDGYDDAAGRIALNVFQPAQVRPPNDAFAARVTLSEGTTVASNEGATGESREPSHEDAGGVRQSVWWRWRAPASGRLRLTTAGSGFDTTLAVYRGSSLAGLLEVEANNDSGGSWSEVEFDAVGGVDYAIAVDGRGNASGTISLTSRFERGVGVANDRFADRATLVERATANNAAASGEAGEPDHALVSSPLASLWWKWRAPSSGRVKFSTAGSGFDTTLGVYRGTRVDALTMVGENDDAPGGGLQSEVEFDAVAGEEYAVAVDGYAGATGSVVLSVDFASSGGPPNGSDITCVIVPLGDDFMPICFPRRRQ